MKNLTLLLNSSSNTAQCQRDYLEMFTFVLATAINLFSNVVFSLALGKLRAPRENKFHLVVKMFTISNTMVVAPLIPLSLASYIKCDWIGGYISCAISGFLSAVFLGWSVCLILLLCFYRYLAIVKPFYYRTQLTPRRTVVIMALSFIWSACHLVLPLFGVGRFRVHSMGWYCSIDMKSSKALDKLVVCAIIVEGLLFTLVLLYFWAALRNVVKTERRLSHQLSPQQFRGANVLGVGRQRDEFARMTLMIAMVYWICSLPYLGYRAVVVLSSGTHSNENAYFCTQMIAYISSFLSILVFLAMNKQYRHALKEYLGITVVASPTHGLDDEQPQFHITENEMEVLTVPIEMYHSDVS